MPTTPHIVFIPGLLCTGELYTAQIAALGTRIRYSIANHGGHNEIRNCAAAILDRAPEKFIPVGRIIRWFLNPLKRGLLRSPVGFDTSRHYDPIRM